MKAQISITPKFEDVNSKDYIDALILEGDYAITIDIRGKKCWIKEEINRKLAGYGLYYDLSDYKDVHNDCGNKVKIKYYYMELPVLIVITTFN